jgi:hypothetical protein
MDWIKLAIPLIVLAIWILGHLLRNQQEEIQPPRRLPPRPDDDPFKARPRRPASDVDRFLEEVRRRREQQQPATLTREEEEAEFGRSSDAPVAKASPPRPVLPRPVEAAQATVKRRPLRESVPTPPPAVASVVEEVVVARLVASPGETSAPIGSTLGLPAALAPGEASRGRPAAAAHLLHLLKTPKSLATAVMLREVFEPPLSRRAGPARGGRS